MRWNVDPGEFDRAIVLQKKSTSPDTEYGGETETWTDHLNLYGKKKDDRGSEGYEASQRVAVGITTWMIWFIPDINARDYRIKDEETGEIYEIIAPPIEIGRRHLMELKTERKDND